MLKKLFPSTCQLINLLHYHFAESKVCSNKDQLCPNSPKDNLFKCWNCENKNCSKAQLVCQHCKFLQDPTKTIDPMSYPINKKEIALQYKKLLKQFHPDSMSCHRKLIKFETIIEFSKCYSTYINEAYNILTDDYLRGVYLLALLKKPIKEQNQDQVQDLDMEFYERMLELQESIENCKNLQEIVKIKILVKEKMQGLIEKINLGFELMNFKLVEELLSKLKYYNNLMNSMNLQEEKFFCKIPI